MNLFIQEDLFTRENQLKNNSDPRVLSEFYQPVLESLDVINSALDTLSLEGDGRDREREQVQQVIEEQVTQGLQTVSLWTECADESAREGGLSQWANTTTFEDENKKVTAAVDGIIRKTEQDKSGFLHTLKSSVTMVTQKINLMMDIALESSKQNLIRIDLDGRVTESILETISTRPWGYQERVENLPSLETFQTMETNIYWFESNNNGQTKRCCVMLGGGQKITFYVASKAVKHIADMVLQAKVLYDGKWSLSETQCQGEYVVFRLEKVEAFFILGTPRERDFNVEPSGSQYIHRTDRRVRLNIPEGAIKAKVVDRNLKQSSNTQKGQSNVNVSSGSEASRAQVAISSGQRVSSERKNQAYYLQHFEEFLKDFSIAFVKDKCQENGIDSLEIFLLLGKEDLMNDLGLVLGDSLKCIQAQKKYRELDK